MLIIEPNVTHEGDRVLTQDGDPPYWTSCRQPTLCQPAHVRIVPRMCQGRRCIVVRRAYSLLKYLRTLKPLMGWDFAGFCDAVGESYSGSLIKSDVLKEESTHESRA